MYYLIFMKKHSGDRFPYAIVEVINAYINGAGSTDLIVSLPGYLSKNQANANDFCDNVLLAHTGKTKKVYFSEGMSKRNCFPGTTIVIQDYHNNYATRGAVISLGLTTGYDHSKMMFFVDDSSNNAIADIRAMNPNIKAALIGSSNQSYNTYLNSPAMKGEADLFIINADAFTVEQRGIIERDLNRFYEQLNDELRERVIFSRQMFGGGYNFLGDIFRDCFGGANNNDNQ